MIRVMPILLSAFIVTICNGCCEKKETNHDGSTNLLTESGVPLNDSTITGKYEGLGAFSVYMRMQFDPQGQGRLFLLDPVLCITNISKFRWTINNGIIAVIMTSQDETHHLNIKASLSNLSKRDSRVDLLYVEWLGYNCTRRFNLMRSELLTSLRQIDNGSGVRSQYSTNEMTK
jgi:hypothetical protein